MSKISKAMERADREEHRGHDTGEPGMVGEVREKARPAEERPETEAGGVFSEGSSARRAPVRTAARAVELPKSAEE